jgi:hypothetical protein
VKGLLATVEAEGIQQPREAEEVVTVQVAEKNSVDIGATDTVLIHPDLATFPTIDEELFALDLQNL